METAAHAPVRVCSRWRVLLSVLEVTPHEFLGVRAFDRHLLEHFLVVSMRAFGGVAGRRSL